MGNRLWELITTWGIKDIIAIIGAAGVIGFGAAWVSGETDDERLPWSYAMWMVMLWCMGFFFFVVIWVVGSLLSLSVKDIAPAQDASAASFFFSTLGYFLITWVISKGLFFPEEWVTAHKKKAVFLPARSGKGTGRSVVAGQETLPTPEQYRFMAWVVDGFAFDFRQRTFSAALLIARETYLWRWDIGGRRSTYPTPVFMDGSSVPNQQGGVEITYTFGNISAVYLTVEFESGVGHEGKDWAWMGHEGKDLAWVQVSWSCHENPLRGGIRVYSMLGTLEKQEDIVGKKEYLAYTDMTSGKGHTPPLFFSNYFNLSAVVVIDTELVQRQLVEILHIPKRVIPTVSTERPLGNKPITYQHKAQEAQALHDAKVAEINAGPGTGREKRDRISALEEIREQTLDALKKKYL